MLMLNPRQPGLLKRLFSRNSAEPKVDPIEVLKSSELFNWASPHIVHAIAGHFQVEKYVKDEVICEQGEDGDRMYIIGSGDVEVVLYTDEDGDNAETIGRLGVGHAFGDGSIAMHSRRTASCLARSPVVTLELSRADYLTLHVADDPIGSVFRQGMVRNLVIQLVATSRRYLALQSVLASTSKRNDRDIWR